MKLKDKRIAVTGAAQGIGRAVAEVALSHGASVALIDNNPSVTETAKAIDPTGDRVRAFQTDVTDVQAVAELFDQIGPLHGLVNNAAIAVKGDFLSITPEDLDTVYSVNLRGYLVVAQQAVRHMSGGAAIVNMSSVNGTVALPDQTAYTITKGGVNQLTKAMALTLAPKAIRVNAVAPGSIATELFRAVVANPEALRTVLSRTPLGHPGEPRDVGELVAFLLSPEAAYITGEVVTIDGGRMALNYTVPVKDD